MKRILLSALVFAFSILTAYAGGPFSEAVQKPISIPNSKSGNIEPNKERFYGLIPKDSPYKKIKCYTDLQMNKYKMSEESHLWCHYIYSTGNYHLVIGDYSAECDNLKTGILYLTNENGDYLDKLEVYNIFGWDTTIREWTMEENVITVYTLIPTQSESISGWDFGKPNIRSFRAARHDCEYVVENGKFKLKREIIYSPMDYTFEELTKKDPFFNIWDKGVVPSKVINY